MQSHIARHKTRYCQKGTIREGFLTYGSYKNVLFRTRKENLTGEKDERLEFLLDVKEKTLLILGVEGVFEAYYHVVKADQVETETSAEQHFVGKTRVEIPFLIVRVIFYIAEICIGLEVN